MSEWFHLTNLRDLSPNNRRGLIYYQLSRVASEVGEEKVKKLLAYSHMRMGGFYGSMEAWIQQMTGMEHPFASAEEVKKMIKALSIDHRAAGVNTSIFEYIMVNLKWPEPEPGDPPWGKGRYLFVYLVGRMGKSIGAMYAWDLGFRAISTAPEETDEETDPFEERLYSDWD